MSSFRETVRIDDVVCEAETDKAIGVRISDVSDDLIWIPKSQVDDDSEVYGKGPRENTGTLIISAWIAEQKHIA